MATGSSGRAGTRPRMQSFRMEPWGSGPRYRGSNPCLPASNPLTNNNLRAGTEASTPFGSPRCSANSTIPKRRSSKNLRANPEPHMLRSPPTETRLRQIVRRRPRSTRTQRRSWGTRCTTSGRWLSKRHIHSRLSSRHRVRCGLLACVQDRYQRSARVQIASDRAPPVSVLPSVV